MTVYLLNLFSIPLYALLLYFAGIDNRKKNRILCGLAGLQLFLTAALRATTVGGDLENYPGANCGCILGSMAMFF